MGHLDILKQLYGKVLIPNAVYMELTSNEKFVTEASQVTDCDFLEVEEVDKLDYTRKDRNFKIRLSCLFCGNKCDNVGE